MPAASDSLASGSGEESSPDESGTTKLSPHSVLSREPNPFGYTFDADTRLSRLKEMDAATLQRVVDMTVGTVQQRVRSAARAKLRKLTKAAGGALATASLCHRPTRVVTTRRIRLNPAQEAHLIRFGNGTETDLFQKGKSKRTSAALYGRGLLSIVEKNDKTGECTYVLTDTGTQLYKEICARDETAFRARVESMEGDKANGA